MNKGKSMVQWFQFEIPKNTAGGEQRITAESDKIPLSERIVHIREYIKPSVNIDINLDKMSYYPGETVNITIDATHANGNDLSNVKSTVTVMMDGQQVFQETNNTQTGRGIKHTLTLEKDIKESVYVSVSIESDALLESKTKSIPVIIPHVNIIYVNFYPEGGNIVDGLENRIYFECYDDNNKPSDINA